MNMYFFPEKKSFSSIDYVNEVWRDYILLCVFIYSCLQLFWLGGSRHRKQQGWGSQPTLPQTHAGRPRLHPWRRCRYNIKKFPFLKAKFIIADMAMKFSFALQDGFAATICETQSKRLGFFRPTMWLLNLIMFTMGKISNHISNISAWKDSRWCRIGGGAWT